MRSIKFTTLALAPVLFAVLGACAAVPAHGAASDVVVSEGSDFTMQPGMQVAFADGGKLRYVRVLGDSRCMPDVQCIWAGDAEVAFEWTPSVGGTQSFSLHTGKAPKQQSLGSRRLVLVSLSRGAMPSAVLRTERSTVP